MISNEGYIDGSWKLKVVSEDLNGVVLLNVFNNTNFGEVANKVSQHFHIDKNQVKHYSFWCPSKMAWLKKPDLTLHQLSLNANTMILYMKKIRQVTIQIGSRENRKFAVDFSLPVLKIIKDLCHELGINNKYIFSLMRYRGEDSFNAVKQKSFINKIEKSPLTVSLRNLTVNHSTSKKRLNRNLGSNCPWTPTSGYGSLSSTMNSLENYRGSYVSISNHVNQNGNIKEIITEKSIYPNLPNHITGYQNNFDRSKINLDWIFSSKSLMEQKLNEHSLLQLKMKSFAMSFDDATIPDESLDFSYDQMKNAILCGEIDLEINIALILGGLQYHIFLSEYQSGRQTNTSYPLKANRAFSLDEEISKMLSDLEKELLIDPYEIESIGGLPCRIDYFVYVHQIIPMKSIDKNIPMKLKLIKDHIKIFKENNLSNARYEFNIKTCHFQTTFGLKSTENFITWTFEYDNKFVKIETKFFSDEDFISIYSCAVCHSNCWRPSLRQYLDRESAVKTFLDIFRSTVEPEYNIFNMPRMELSELLGCRTGKKELSSRYLKTILQYSCSFKSTTLRQSKIQYMRFCMNIPRYNYHYFFADIVEPVDIGGPTILAINEEMFMVLDSASHSIKRFVSPWTILKSWTINTELNKLELRFEKQHISFIVNHCSAVCFHEFLSTFIWLTVVDNSKDKTENLTDLLNLMTVNT